MSATRGILFFLCALLFVVGCQNSSDQPRHELSELGVEYSKANFFNRIKRGDRKVVELFLESGMNANSLNNEGKSALDVAVRSGEKSIVDLLLEEGANPNGRDRRKEEESWTSAKNVGNSPLEAAHWSYVNAAESNELLRKKYLSIAELLLREGANVNAENDAGNTVLINAAGGLEIELVDLYLEHGANVDHVGNEGYTALLAALDLAAAMSEDEGRVVKVVRRLLEAGADVNHQDQYGRTALMKTASNKIIKMLITHGAKVNLKNEDGKTALLQTVESIGLYEAFAGESTEGKKDVENEKALMLARNGADVSEAVEHLRNEGYDDFAEKLVRASRRSAK